MMIQCALQNLNLFQYLSNPVILLRPCITQLAQYVEKLAQRHLVFQKYNKNSLGQNQMQADGS